MATTNSIETYLQTKELRQKNKDKVFAVLQTERNQSRFQIGRITGLGDIESQRRLSDLVAEDKAVITGSRKHFNREISLYSAKEQLYLFTTKKQRLSEWLKEKYPAIYSEFKELKND